MDKGNKWRKIMFWIGVLYGTVFTSAVAFFPVAIRFFRIDPFVYLGAGGITTHLSLLSGEAIGGWIRQMMENIRIM